MAIKDERQSLDDVMKAMLAMQERGKAVAKQMTLFQEGMKQEFTPKPLPTLSQLSVLQKDAQEGR